MITINHIQLFDKQENESFSQFAGMSCGDEEPEHCHVYGIFYCERLRV